MHGAGGAADSAMQGGDFLGLGPVTGGVMSAVGMGTAALAGLNKEHLLDPAQSSELMDRSQCLWSFARRAYTSDPPGGQRVEDQQAAYTIEEEPMNAYCWERTPKAWHTGVTPLGSKAVFMRGQLRDIVSGSTYYLLLTTYYSLLTTHNLLLTTHYLLLATCYLLLATDS